MLSTGANAAFTATGGGTVDVCGGTVNRRPARQHDHHDDRHRAQRGEHHHRRQRADVPQHLGQRRRRTASCSTNTGATAGLTVTGTGTAGSGGTIQNITNRGASFINAVNISLTDMNFINANTTDGGKLDGVISGNTDENAAINLQNVTQVDLTDLVIDGTVQHGINGSNVTDLDITARPFRTPVTRSGSRTSISGI